MQDSNHFTRAERIHVTERAAKERRETNAKYRADVAIACTLDHLLIKAARRFIEHHHHAALSALNGGQFSLTCGRNESIYRRVDLFPAFTPFRAVKIETAFIFSAFAIVLQNRRNNVCRWAKTIAICSFQHWYNFSAGVYSHLIQKLDWANGETKLYQRLVDVLNLLPFRQQPHCFINVGSQNAVDVEASFVRYHNRGFALFFRQLHHGGNSLRAGSRVWNNFHQRHFFDRAKEMQPNHLLRAGGFRSDIANR